MTSALSMQGLTKAYRRFRLGPLALDLEPGVVLGYIGPNASGKTTTFHCITRLIRPDNGKVSIFGRENDPRDPTWKLDIGYVGDRHAFFEGWTARQNLRFRSQFYPDWSETRTLELAGRFGLPLDSKARNLSSGDRVKLSIVAALAHSPRLLLLDEPTVGLDPVVRREVLDTLFELMETGERSVLYATHILTDISRLADELAFLIGGELILRCPKDDLLDKWRRVSFRYAGDAEKIEAVVEHLRDGPDHRVISANIEPTLRQLRALGAENIEEKRMTIDEIAIEIIKGGEHVVHH